MTCTKKSYDTRSHAASAIRLVKKTSSKDDIPTRYYICEECGKLHLTKMTTAKSRTPKEKMKGKMKVRKFKPHEINESED